MMAISYPLAFPTVKIAKSIKIRMASKVAISSSPFTFEQQIYAHQGEWQEADIQIPPMERADAETFIAFLAALNGQEGTFLMGDPVGATPRGLATGSPVVDGASQTGKTLNTRGWTAGVNGILLSGDWIQLGSGSTTHLHKIVQDADSNVGSPITDEAVLEIWPRLRSSPSDGDVIVVNSAKGIWRLPTNVREYTIEEAVIFGVAFSAMEAL